MYILCNIKHISSLYMFKTKVILEGICHNFNNNTQSSWVIYIKLQLNNAQAHVLGKKSTVLLSLIRSILQFLNLERSK